MTFPLSSSFFLVQIRCTHEFLESYSVGAFCVHVAKPGNSCVHRRNCFLFPLSSWFFKEPGNSCVHRRNCFLFPLSSSFNGNRKQFCRCLVYTRVSGFLWRCGLLLVRRSVRPCLNFCVFEFLNFRKTPPSVMAVKPR